MLVCVESVTPSESVYHRPSHSPPLHAYANNSSTSVYTHLPDHFQLLLPVNECKAATASTPRRPLTIPKPFNRDVHCVLVIGFAFPSSITCHLSVNHVSQLAVHSPKHPPRPGSTSQGGHQNLSSPSLSLLVRPTNMSSSASATSTLQWPRLARYFGEHKQPSAVGPDAAREGREGGPRSSASLQLNPPRNRNAVAFGLLSTSLARAM